MTGESGDKTIPAAPLALGLAGLMPFWGLALAILLGLSALPPPTTLGAALATYGAVIVSFLGGIRWGLATRSGDQRAVARHYAIAVVPSLLAWAALALPTADALGALGIVALALGALDQGLVGAGLAPPWFGRLRLILSGGAGSALVLAGIVAGVRAG